MKTRDKLIIYHAECSDGFGSAYAAWKKFGDTADYLACSYDQPPPDVTGKDVFILDFSYPPEVLFKLVKQAVNITIIDHHKDAMEAIIESDILQDLVVVYDNCNSGCILTWEYLHNSPAPQLLKHIEDSDLGEHALPDTRAIFLALHSVVPYTFEAWDEVIRDTESLEHLKRIGTILLSAQETAIVRLSTLSTTIVLNDTRGLCCNAPQTMASDLGNILAEQCGTFGLVFSFDGRKHLWKYSLRSNGKVDVAVIAREFGGNGHANAAGFTLPHLLI